MTSANTGPEKHCGHEHVDLCRWVKTEGACKINFGLACEHDTRQRKGTLSEYLGLCSMRELAEYVISTMGRGFGECDSCQKDALEALRSRPLSDMGAQEQQRVFQKQCIGCCNMRCPNQNKDIENILKCPEYLASPRPEAQPQDAAVGKADLVSLSEAIGAIEKIYFRIDCYEEDVVKEEAACDALSEAMRAVERLGASPGKASGDVLAELERDLKATISCNMRWGASLEPYYVGVNTHATLMLQKIATLRQVQ